MPLYLKNKFLWMAMCVVILCSCGYEHEVEPDSDSRTILMYLPYTGPNSLYQDFLRNIEDVSEAIKEQSGLGNNRYLVFISRSKNEAVFMELKYDTRYRRVVNDTIETVVNPELTTAGGIATILNKVKNAAPADRYALIAGCHGEGWLPASPNGPNRTRWYGSSDEPGRTDISTLAKAIGMTQMHMEYMLFDMCYISCIETAYDLRNATDCIIGSTSEVMNYGMPYKKVLPHILRPTPDYEGVVKAYNDFYTNYYAPYATIAATNTEHMDDMASMMREINAKYSITDENLARVQDLDGDHFNPTVYYDFGDYVEKMLEGAGRDAQAKELLSQFHTLLNKLVPYKATTGSIMSSAGSTVLPVNAFSGLTISDPSINANIAATKSATAWWAATH